MGLSVLAAVGYDCLRGVASCNAAGQAVAIHDSLLQMVGGRDWRPFVRLLEGRMRYILLFSLLFLSGYYYPYYGYPYAGGYPYPAYAPGYQPNGYRPNSPPPSYGGPPSYPGNQQQPYGGAPQLRYGTPGPLDPQNCGTPDAPHPFSGSNR